MRYALLLMGLALGALTGATCVNPPLGADDPNLLTTLIAVTINSPSRDRTVPQGTSVDVNFSGAYDNDGSATITIFAENRATLAVSAIYTVNNVKGTIGPITVQWDTANVDAGLYSLRARISDGIRTRDHTAAGRITIDAAPSFVFLSPAVDTEKQTDTNLPIRFRAFDPENQGSVRIQLDTDSDHASGNEITINQQDLPTTSREITIDWNGRDTGNTAVPVGTYNYFALLEDGINPIREVEGLARIIVPEPPEEEEEDPPVELSIRQPSKNVEFIPGAPAALHIEFGVNSSSDTLIDLKIDSDDNHGNGNEVTILSQRFVEANTETDSFDWLGTNSAGGAPAPGIYTLLIVQNTGSGAATTRAGTAQIFLRSADTAETKQTWELASSNWTLIDPEASPSQRRDHAIAYDVTRSRSVLFGGLSGGTASNETWEYDRVNWTQRTINGPTARFEHSMAFDRDRNVTVLFGGTDGTTISDETWTYNGTDWTNAGVAGPGARHDHAAAFDRHRGVTIVFGGFDGTNLLDDTWEWDGTIWTLRAPASSPTPRRGHALAYDEVKQSIVLFGGQDAGGVNDETWEWDGTTWTQKSPAHVPFARRNHTLTSDTGRNLLVLFGGGGGNTALSDTWTWNGEDWGQLDPAQTPAAREGHAAAYDIAGSRVVVFGGGAGLPLISILEPNSTQTVDPGAFVSIRWRDDDPSGRAIVRLALDDDATPAEGAETGDPEVEVLASRDAKPDGVQDSFSWQVPATLDPGTYFLFAYIDSDGAAPHDNRAVAGGRIIVRDPTGN
ncbi:MAG: hypothetical protein JNG88_01765 [Phycisphaerales bacterium]|nr:hypothetical protein [Phycisphaerales bacterium]